MSEENAVSDLHTRIERLLAEEIVPLLEMDGGGVELVGIDAGVVRVRLHGSCGGCPSTIMAIIMSVEQELRKHIPEVEYLEAVP